VIELHAWLVESPKFNPQNYKELGAADQEVEIRRIVVQS
jgi:hypothetical protein